MFPFVKLNFKTAVLMSVCDVFVDGLTHELSEIDGNGVANHLFYVSLVADKLVIARECLNVTAFERREWSDALL